MKLKSVAYDQLFAALLLIQYNLMLTSAAGNMAQLKNQQRTFAQPSTEQHHQQKQREQQTHSVYVHSQMQQQRLKSQRQSVQPTKATHPSSIDSEERVSNDYTQVLTSPASLLTYSPSTTQFIVNDKEAATKKILKHCHTDNDLNDSYHILNKFKREAPASTNNDKALPLASPLLPSPTSANSAPYPLYLYDITYGSTNPTTRPPMRGLQFNSYEAFPTPISIIPRFLPSMTYPYSVYIPYPPIISPEMFYSGFSPISLTSIDYEDSMSRGVGASKRSASIQHSSIYSHNSPIYSIRLPHTPYIYLPSLRLRNPNTSMPSYPTILPYQTVLNIPIQFLANGKPNNIYQMSGQPNEMQKPFQFGNIPSPPNHYKPADSSNSYFSSQPPPASFNHGSSPLSSITTFSPAPNHDSKLTVLKHPYFFNGRPEEMYILPNNFNPLYSSAENTYN